MARMLFRCTNGFCQIDESDYEDLVQFTWRLWSPKTCTTTYVIRSWRQSGKGYNELMHRRLMGLPQGVKVDHINGDGTDNRRENLRLADKFQNMHNSRLRKDNTSGHKGCYWNKRAERWQARVGLNGKEISIGYFDRLEDAAEAVRAARERLHGEFANHGS